MRTVSSLVKREESANSRWSRIHIVLAQSTTVNTFYAYLFIFVCRCERVCVCVCVWVRVYVHLVDTTTTALVVQIFRPRTLFSICFHTLFFSSLVVCSFFRCRRLLCQCVFFYSILCLLFLYVILCVRIFSSLFLFLTFHVAHDWFQFKRVYVSIGENLTQFALKNPIKKSPKKQPLIF